MTVMSGQSTVVFLDDRQSARLHRFPTKSACNTRNKQENNEKSVGSEIPCNAAVRTEERERERSGMEWMIVAQDKSVKFVIICSTAPPPPLAFR